MNYFMYICFLNKYMSSISSSVFNDLKFHLKLVGQFGMGIGFLYPIVLWLFDENNIGYTLFNKDHIILFLIYLAFIIYIDIEKDKEIKKSFSSIYRFIKAILNSLVDLLAYTFLLVSFLKLIEIIKIYNTTTFLSIILGIIVGVLLLVLKHIMLKYQEEII